MGKFIKRIVSLSLVLVMLMDIPAYSVKAQEISMAQGGDTEVAVTEEYADEESVSAESDSVGVEIVDETQDIISDSSYNENASAYDERISDITNDTTEVTVTDDSQDIENKSDIYPSQDKTEEATAGSKKDPVEVIVSEIKKDSETEEKDGAEDPLVIEPIEGEAIEEVKTLEEDPEETSDEMVLGYFEQELYSGADGGVSMFSSNHHEYMFSESPVQSALYEAIKSRAKNIASGTESSAIIEISLNDIYPNKKWKGTELGASRDFVYEDMYDEDKTVSTVVKNWIVNTYMNHYDEVYTAAKFDCPYEFYWGGLKYGASVPGYSMKGSMDGDELLIDLSSVKFILKMQVNKDYRLTKTQDPDNPNDISYMCYADTSKTGAVSFAATNALSIVRSADGKSDYEKLRAYLYKLCELNTYNQAAVDDTDKDKYGDPWQVIYMFDGDPTTNVVCEGYSKSFAYLCELSEFESSEIECLVVSGYAFGGGHMWNVMHMDDGKNYLVDCTNCDQSVVMEDLFITPYYSDKGEYYMFKLGGSAYSFRYDDDTKNSYTTSELTISSTAYEVKESALEPQEAPGAPTCSSYTSNSVTLTSVLGCEYTKDGGMTWQSSNVFTNLTPNTTYTFNQRKYKTSTAAASPMSAGLDVTTDKATAATPASPTVISRTTSSITLQAMAGYEYRYRKDGTAQYSAWQDSNVFTGLTANTKYQLSQRVKATSSTYESAASSETAYYTDKETAATPAVVITSSVTGNSITVNSTTGYEYRIQEKGDASTLKEQSSNVFTGLKPVTTYVISQRVAATSDKYASEWSTEVEVTTDKLTYAKPSAPVLKSATETKIVLVTAASGYVYEYSIYDAASGTWGAWQIKNTFEGLTQNTTYRFRQRYRADATHYASDISNDALLSTTAASGIINESGTIKYYVNGVVNTSFNDYAWFEGKLYKFNNGISNSSLLAGASSSEIIEDPADNIYKCFKNGVVDTSYQKYAWRGGKLYQYRNGIEASLFSGAFKDPADNDKLKYAANGQISTSFTGLYILDSDQKCYYFTNGLFDNTFNGIAVYNGKTYSVKDGVATGLLNGYGFTNAKWHSFVNGVDQGIIDKKVINLGTAESPEYVYINNGDVDRQISGILQNSETGKYHLFVTGFDQGLWTGFADIASKWHEISAGVDLGLVNNRVIDINCVSSAVSAEPLTPTYKYIKNGVADTTFNSYALNELDSKYHKFNAGNDVGAWTGLVYTSTNGFQYCSKGTINPTYTGLAYKLADGKYYYLKDGSLDSTFNGQVYFVDKWHSVKNGVDNGAFSGIMYDTYNSVWIYTVSGKKATDFTGAVYSVDRWYRITKGAVIGEYNGIMYDTYNKVNIYCVDGKKATSFTGPVYSVDRWYRITNGVVNGEYNGIMYDSYNKQSIYCVGGKKATTYTGPVYSVDRWYNVKAGVNVGEYNGIMYDTYNKVSIYCINGKKATTVTGKIYYAGCWYDVKAGVSLGAYTGVMYDTYNKVVIYTTDGKKDKTFNKQGYYIDRWYKFSEGVKQGAYTGLMYDTYNKVWIYTVDGKRQNTFNGIYNNWCIKNGAIYSYTGLWEDQGNGTGWWYVEAGKVNTAYNDIFYTPANVGWLVLEGRPRFKYTGWYESAKYGWKFIKDGKVQ